MTSQPDTYVYTVLRDGFIGGTTPISIPVETARAQLLKVFENRPDFVGLVISNEKLSAQDVFAAVGKG